MIIENANIKHVNNLNEVLADEGKGIYVYKGSDTPLNISASNNDLTVPVAAIQSNNNPLNLTVTADGVKINRTGWYSIYAQIDFTTTVSNNVLTLSLLSNTRTLAAVTKLAIVNADDQFSLCRAFCYLVKDETVNLKVNGKGAVTAKGGEYKSFMDIRLVKYI